MRVSYDISEQSTIEALTNNPPTFGDSYTMFGPVGDTGHIPVTVRDLLSCLTDLRAVEWTWKSGLLHIVKG